MTAAPLPEWAIEERFLAAGGPGGQNVNKLASAVELRLPVTALDLDEPQRRRLVRLAGRRLSAQGILIIQAREHRTQEANRRAARARLAALLAAACTAPRPRRPTQPGRAATERRLAAKARRSRIKAGRGAPQPD